MGTFILKGSAVAGTLSDNDIGKAHFVRIVATAGTNTITVKDGISCNCWYKYYHG